MAAMSRPGRAARRRAAWRTCCRPGATSTPSIRAPCRRQAAWQVGQELAHEVLERYRIARRGAYPETVGISVWGTSAMRTHGDDVAEVLRAARRPAASGRRRTAASSASRSIPLADLGRPRIDVTVPHQRLLPRRLPAPDHAARRGRADGRRAATSRPSRTSSASTTSRRARRTSRPGTCGGGRNGRRATASSAASRAAMARASCR